MNQTPLYLVGLTGNIACGKSTVLELLAAKGAAVIDADQVTHALQQPGQPVYHQIVQTFGSGILAAPDGPIDRRRLGAIVFSDPVALRQLEQIVHPAVRERIFAWLEGLRPGDQETRRPGDTRHETRDTETGSHEDQQTTGSQSHVSRLASRVSPSPPLSSLPAAHVAVIDAIKLLESGWKERCDAIWVVTCAPEQQLARLVATRGMSAAEAQARIDAQPPQAEKVAQADVVIDNSGTLEQTRRQVDAAWSAIAPPGE